MESDRRAEVEERRIGDLVLDMHPMREATEVADLFAGLADSVLNTLKADACLVSICDGEAGKLRDVAASVLPGVEMNILAQEYSLADFPTTKAVIDDGSYAEISATDPGADKSERRFLIETGFERMLICGFAMEDGVKGTVEAFRSDDRAFRADDHEQVDLVVAFAANNYSRIQLAERLESHYTETIEALTSALEARDPYTEAHTGRIRDLALALAFAMKVGPDERKAVHLGALLHDVGKIGVSDAILRKPGPLSDDEWNVMREHPEIGERMLAKVDFLQPALTVVRHHHERWDGKGYPDGLKGEDIPLAARIVGVCDAYDAMTSDRPYRKAMSREDACVEILTSSGSQFDPRCAQLLVDVVKRVGETDLEERFIRYSS